MQGSTLEQLRQRLRSANAEARRQAAEQLGQLKDERAVEALIEALTREARNWPGDWQVKDTVASALITLEDARVVPALVEILQHDQDLFVQELAAETLMRIEGVPLEVLVLVLQAGGGVVGMGGRGHAAAVLGEMGDARAVEPLIAALQGNDTNGL
ncbi:MAG TPA: HEAT repeat domain-containing protein [Ktedonobacteraceae bacterium]|nr:HEAT repeat domain-containing protein [Ktedonobacteraceae bacterium]